jgi:hypothetical protein
MVASDGEGELLFNRVGSEKQSRGGKSDIIGVGPPGFSGEIGGLTQKVEFFLPPSFNPLDENGVLARKSNKTRWLGRGPVAVLLGERSPEKEGFSSGSGAEPLGPPLLIS